MQICGILQKDADLVGEGPTRSTWYRRSWHTTVSSRGTTHWFRNRIIRCVCVVSQLVDGKRGKSHISRNNSLHRQAFRGSDCLQLSRLRLRSASQFWMYTHTPVRSNTIANISSTILCPCGVTFSSVTTASSTPTSGQLVSHLPPHACFYSCFCRRPIC